MPEWDAWTPEQHKDFQRRMDEHFAKCPHKCFEPKPLLILIRGLPGSGKSTLAKKFAGEKGVIHSADDKFIKNGVYEFNIEKLSQNHFENFMDAVKSMKEGIATIVIDNTNIISAHCRNYVDAAKTYGYKIIVEETQTPWRFDIEELLKRNIHNVSRESIEAMITNYEPLDLFKEKLEIK